MGRETLGRVVRLGLVQALLPRGAYPRPLRTDDDRDSQRARLQYSPFLRSFTTTLTIVSMAKVEHADDESAHALKRIWNTATGQE